MNSEAKAAPMLRRDDECSEHGRFEAMGLVLPGGEGKTIWSPCPDCSLRDSELEAAKKREGEATDRQRRIEARLNRAGIPKRFREKTFENFLADTEKKRAVLAVAKDFAERFEQHKKIGSTLIFAGKIGTGKGHLAIAAAQQVMAGGQSVFFATAREIVLMLRAGWGGQSGAAASEIETLRMLTSVDLLVIDDVGVQFGSDAERDQLFGVIDGRYRDLAPTIITTNLNRALLKEVLGERSYSRLREGGQWVVFDWEDHRSRLKVVQ